MIFYRIGGMTCAIMAGVNGAMDNMEWAIYFVICVGIFNQFIIMEMIRKRRKK